MRATCSPSRPRRRLRGRCRRTPTSVPLRPRPCTPRARCPGRGRPPRTLRGRSRAWSRAPARAAPGRPRSRLYGDRSAERTLQLLEEAFVVTVGVLVARRVELLEQAPLLLAQVPGNGDVHEDALIAAPETLQHRHPLAAQHAHVARL